MYILILIILITHITNSQAISIFDEKRGVDTVKVTPKAKPKAKLKTKIIPMYMKLIGMTQINNKVNLQFYDVQRKKSKNITWDKTMKDNILIKNFYKIDRIESKHRSIVLRTKDKVKCQEKKELNLFCNKNNEFVLKLFKNKPTRSRGKVNRNSKNFDKLAGRPINNPFAKAIKKK